MRAGVGISKESFIADFSGDTDEPSLSRNSNSLYLAGNTAVADFGYGFLASAKSEIAAASNHSGNCITRSLISVDEIATFYRRASEADPSDAVTLADYGRQFE